MRPRVHITLLATSDPNASQLKIQPLVALCKADHDIYTGEIGRVWDETRMGVHPKAAVRAGIIRLRNRGFQVIFDQRVVAALKTLEVA